MVHYLRRLFLLAGWLAAGGRAVAGGALPADSARDWPAAWRSADTDQTRLQALLNLDLWYQEADSGQAQQYGRYGLRLARQLGSAPLEADVWNKLGASHHAGHRYAQARRCFERALALVAPLHDRARIAKCHRGLGNAWAEEQRYAQARWEYWQELRLVQQLSDRHKIGEAYFELGTAYAEDDQDTRGLRYLLRSLRMAEQDHDVALLPMVLRFLGRFYQGQDDLPRAAAYLRQAFRVQQRYGTPKEKGSAEVALGLAYGQNHQDSLSAWHLRAGLQTLQQVQPRPPLSDMAFALYGLADLAAHRPDAAQAVAYYRRAAALFAQQHMTEQHVSTLNTLALFYVQQGRLPSAQQAGQEALARAGSSLFSRAESCDALAQVYAASHDYAAAYRYQKRYQGLNDSLLSRAKAQQLAALSARYQSQQQQAQISLLQRNTALQDRARNLLAGSLAAVGLMGAATYRRYRRERRARRQLQAQELELAARNQALVRAEQRLHQSLEEKEVLLKEVHHRVKNNLQVIASRLALQAQEQRAHPAVTAALRDGQNWVKSVALIHEMLCQSDDLAALEGQPFLEQLAAQLGRAFGGGAGAVTWAVHAPSVRLGPHTAVPLGLIVNELLSNVYKHAFADGRAGHVDIDLAAGPGGAYRLRVRDNGAGLPAGFSLETTASLGLRLVRSLARQLDGTLALGQPAVGTEFCLTLRELPEPGLP